MTNLKTEQLHYICSFVLCLFKDAVKKIPKTIILMNIFLEKSFLQNIMTIS